MKKGIFKKLLTGALACMMCLTAIPSRPDTLAAADRCDQGTQDGYDWELWNQYDQGTANMQLLGNGTFSCEWSGIENVLFRTGKKWTTNSPQWDTLNGIKMDYAADYQPNGNSYLSVYGWTKSPLVEYYIIESWGTWRPPGGTGYKDTITVDGVEYDVYQTTRVQQPSIEGTQTFPQYFSVRKEGDKSTSGTVDIAKHFAAWENLGLDMGGLYEVSLVVEGYQSSGKATVTKNNITLGGGTSTDTDEPVTPSDPVEPDENGYYFHSTYESGSDSWTSRGASTVSATNNASYAGSQSLYVADRTDTWHGAGYTLDDDVFVPGSSYSFSVMAMQETETSADFKLSLQYDDSSGEQQYVTVAEATGAKGAWTQLANTSFTIPSDASNMLLYVETAEGLTSFYIDEAIGAVEGTVIKAETVVTSPEGDVNGDGTADSSDLKAMRDFIMGKSTSISAENADLDGSGRVDSADMAILRQLLTAADEGTGSENTNTGNTTVTMGDTPDISWIDTSKPMVALSFDDGPISTAENSAPIRIQNALSENGFHATFFYWGERINSSNEAEITRAHNLGFEVANHTYTHPYLTNLSADGIKEEIQKTADILTRLTGRTKFIIRPPYLAVNSTVQQNVGAPLITCSVDSQDWNGATSQQIIDTIVSKMNDGSLDNAVVLMHENYDSTATAIEYLVPYLKQNGWQVVTVSEMFAANNKTMTDGTVYSSAN